MPPPPTGTFRPSTANTRSSSRLGTQEIIATKNEVSDAVSAKAHLEKTAMAILGKPYTFDNISDILFHITQMPGVTLPVQTAIRAIAFILEEAAEVVTANSVAKLVITAIAPHIANIQGISESMTSIASKMEGSQEKINESITSISGNNVDAFIGTAALDSRLANVQEAVTTLTTQVKEASQQQGSYKTALLSGPKDNRLDAQTIQRTAREAIKARQILISLPPDSPLGPGKLSHSQLVEKIKEALKTISKEGAPELTIRTVTQYRNGGTVLEMLTTEGATYIKKPDIKNEFIKILDPSATIKDRIYPAIIQFVPLTFNPSDPEHLRELEIENKWNEGELVSARWIKPPGKRASNQ
ncbi:uncharacterized protein F5891DRAFT_1196443 [Suillus fuscotomentosus]|uniref:Uncharacterized protein n=1 Tax=Suillus fuscotomentosus TaxID=1912939 RepID=A0AAD4HFB8_9AGAM|nr:uncharacterized protein F5891DRAFT_1196443 [Suillus fuscotomentosus]KAG1893399.1 hypothetical protein F5891DRAFT_1196443 [Suillus fuscotomentosus]